MKRIILYILLATFALPLISSAQNEPGLLDPVPDSYKLLAPLPCIEGPDTTCNAGELETEMDISSYINYVFKFFIAAAAFLAIVMIIYGGIQYMVSEVPFVKTNAKSTLTNAFIGLGMVLVSYLFLATIDPRLVEINTTIEPIDISRLDLEGVEGFRNDLERDIARTSAENQLKFQQLRTEQESLETQLKDLQAQRGRGEIAEETFLMQEAILKQQLSGIKVDRGELIAENTGESSFETALNYIYNVEGEDRSNISLYTADPIPKTDEYRNGQYRTDTPNEIQRQYNEQINRLLAIEPRTDKIAEAIPTLIKQRDFYIETIKEENELANEIRFYVQTPIPEIQPAARASLEKKLAEYEANLETTPLDPTEIGITEERYKNIMKVRIERIKNSFNEVDNG